MKDIAVTIFYCSEALVHISKNLPEDMSGLAYMLVLMGEKLAKCGEVLDEALSSDNTE